MAVVEVAYVGDSVAVQVLIFLYVRIRVFCAHVVRCMWLHTEMVQRASSFWYRKVRQLSS